MWTPQFAGRAVSREFSIELFDAGAGDATASTSGQGSVESLNSGCDVLPAQPKSPSSKFKCWASAKGNNSTPNMFRVIEPSLPRGGEMGHPAILQVPILTAVGIKQASTGTVMKTRPKALLIRARTMSGRFTWSCWLGPVELPQNSKLSADNSPA